MRSNPSQTSFFKRAGRKIYRIINGLINSILDLFKPYLRTLTYNGFVLYYSRGNSLVTRIKSGELYEPEVTKALLKELRDIEQPVFLDIGANIGLITLNILRSVPNARAFAFEPGHHQYSLLQKTVEANRLENIRIYNYALGNSSGDRDFAIHNPNHAAGDGFIDTGRSGSARCVVVKVKTLDEWWEESGYPSVNLIKLDTEGAELWVLQGAIGLLEQCKPTILLEISHANLASYPYNAPDVIRFLNESRFTVETIDGKPASPDTIGQLLEDHVDFIARY